MRKSLLNTTVFFLLLACGREKNNYGATVYNSEVKAGIPLKWDTIRLTSENQPASFPLQKVETVPVRETISPFTGKNTKMLSSPVSLPAKKPVITTPGVGQYLKPPVVESSDSSFPAGSPEVVLVGDPQVAVNNQFSFSTYKTLEGLKTNMVFPMALDRSGNIWISQYEGGVTKYDGRSFSHYTKAQGLENSYVWSIMEDSHSNLWFGFLQGAVSKFDGKSFTRYPGLRKFGAHSVISLFEDRDHNVWLGTTDVGVIKFDGHSFVQYSTAQGLPDTHIRIISSDTNGHLWLGTNRGVVRFDGKSFHNYSVDQGLCNNTVTGIVHDVDKNTWIATVNGLSRFDGTTFTTYKTENGLSSNELTSLLLDRSGKLWVGTQDHGVTQLDGNQVSYFEIDNGLSGNTVHRIIEDRSGNTWFGIGGGGVCKYDGGAFTHFSKAQGFAGVNNTSVIEDASGNILMGNWGAGIERFDGKSITKIRGIREGSENGVNTLFADSKGNTWIGCWGKGVAKFDGRSLTRYRDSSGLTSNYVSAIMEDSQKDLWFATGLGISRFDGKNFTHYTTKQGLSSNNVYALYQDKAENIWIGTYGRGINRFDGKNLYRLAPNDALSRLNITCIYEDSRANLWFGTTEGVIRLTRNLFFKYDKEDGLPSNHVNSIIEDRKGNVYLLTTNGLSKWQSGSTNDKQQRIFENEERPLFKNYLVADGFFGVGSDANSMTMDRQGKIWIATYDRITCFDPEKDIPDTIPPDMQLTGMKLFNQNLNWQQFEKNPDTSLVLGNGVRIKNVQFSDLSKFSNVPVDLNLPYDNNYLAFQFVGATTKRPRHILYRYTLTGFEENWSTLTSSPEAIYNNLPPGHYTFKVKAVNSEGYWSNELSYRFTIRPPWWSTWAFRIITVLLLALLFYGLIKWRLQQQFRQKLAISEKEKQLADLRHKAIELEMQALRSQMNPHFIFNSLNSINRFILQNNKANASEYLTKFSKLMRLILQNSQATLISLESELDALGLYLELESLRFDHRFEFRIIVDEDLDISAIQVPPLIIQPYAENAIWHGLMHKEETGHLEIILSEEANFLVCKIVDDGIGRKKAAELKSKSGSGHKSMGMRITSDRIAIIQQKEQFENYVLINDIVLPDGTAGGTEVVLKIPITE